MLNGSEKFDMKWQEHGQLQKKNDQVQVDLRNKTYKIKLINLSSDRTSRRSTLISIFIIKIIYFVYVFLFFK